MEFSGTFGAYSDLKVSEVIAILDDIAPPYLAMNWDKKGVLVGDFNAEVTKIGVALDITKEMVDWAIESAIDLLIAHHPLIFSPQESILATVPHPDAVIIDCIRNHISVACVHTNWDIATGGINDVLAEIVGLRDTKPVEITQSPWGLGRIGDLETPMTGAALIAHLQSALDYLPIRPTMGIDLEKMLTRVAVGGGACAHLMPLAISQGAQALVTSDVRHHEFIAAQSQGFLLIDAGHAATEIPGTRELARLMSQKILNTPVLFFG